MPFDPTPEQQAVVDAALTGGDIVVTAAAGAGKTSTMRLLTEAMPSKRGLYGAFNKKAQVDAKGTFPRSVSCMTSSALARRYLIQVWGDGAWDLRMNAPRQSGRDQAAILGIRGPHRISPEKVLAPQQVARVVMETVQRFAYSADPYVDAQHVATVNGVESFEERNELRGLVVPLARKAWAEVSRPEGQLKLTFDHAMKMWGLSGTARLPFDFVIVDEAQDTNPVWGKIVSTQACQKVVVGDKYQQMYAWRGAVDAMDAFPCDHRLTLTQSFRFGPAIADEANKWLSLLGAEFQVRGFEPVGSRLGVLPQPDAVLCRTNAEAMSTLMRFQAAGVNAGLVGGAESIRKMAEAAEQLKETGNTWHPELCAFTSWGAVQDFAENDFGGGDLAVFVKLIDEYGTRAVIAAADRCTPEGRADVVVSTAHKAKGGEWDTVRIATDFPEPREDDFGAVLPPPRADMMTAYVAVTRAKKVLDREGLAWVDRFLGGGRMVGATNSAAINNPALRPAEPPRPAGQTSGAYEYRLLDADGQPLGDWTGDYSSVYTASQTSTGLRIDSRATATSTAAPAA